MALKKHNPGCNCCPTDDPCVGFRECFGIQCVPPPCHWTRTIEITFQGFSEGNCGDCEALNRTYLFPPSMHGSRNACEIEFHTFGGVLSICFFIISMTVTFRIRRNQLGVFDLYIHYSGQGASAGAEYYHPDIFSSDVLCQRQPLVIPSITEPYTTPGGNLGCNYDGSPAILRIA